MKEQGFTLIELLAVIVILAIIALIATPIVLNIIKDSKENAQLNSANMYLDAVEQSIAKEKMNETTFNPNICEIQENGNLICDKEDQTKKKDVTVEVKGETPKSGKITFKEGNIYEVTLVYNETTTITKDSSGSLIYSDDGLEDGSGSKETYISLGNYQHQTSSGVIESHDTESGTCSKCGQNVLAPGIYAEDGFLLANWQELMNLVDNDTFIYDSLIGYYGEHGEPSKLIISDTATSIKSSAFQGVVSLNEVVIPTSVVSIESYAFVQCENLSTINYAGTMEQWNSIDLYADGMEDWNAGCPEIIIRCTNGNISIPAYQ